MFGALTARSEAQVMRMAMIYALMDQAKVIRIEHLRAALAMWQYIEDSVRFILGDALGEPMADAILREPVHHQAGMTRTEIMNGFLAPYQG